VSCAIQGEWEDLRQMPRPPKTLEARISALFVHRDAENASRHVRRSEIAAAVQAATFEEGRPPVWVSVIPVRMQEAWFLFDEIAIRRAVGNPSGRVTLHLPSLDKCEDMADPN
jgi:hypothetical protein